MFKCAYCLEVGTPPIVMLTCGHSFCFACIEIARETKPIMGFICCLCRQPQEMDEYINNKGLTDLIKTMYNEDDFNHDDQQEDDNNDENTKKKNFNVSRDKMELWVQMLQNNLEQLESIYNHVEIIETENTETYEKNVMDEKNKYIKGLPTQNKKLTSKLDNLKNEFDVTINCVIQYKKELEYQIEGTENIITTLRSLIKQDDEVYVNNLITYEPYIRRITDNILVNIKKLSSHKHQLIKYIDECKIIYEEDSNIILYDNLTQEKFSPDLVLIKGFKGGAAFFNRQITNIILYDDKTREFRVAGNIFIANERRVNIFLNPQLLTYDHNKDIVYYAHNGIIYSGIKHNCDEYVFKPCTGYSRLVCHGILYNENILLAIADEKDYERCALYRVAKEEIKLIEKYNRLMEKTFITDNDNIMIIKRISASKVSWNIYDTNNHLKSRGFINCADRRTLSYSSDKLYYYDSVLKIYRSSLINE